MREKRTKINWSKHKLSIIKNEHVLIHHLKKPDSYINSVKFINTGDICAVTGDYGNWIFCREYHPSKDGYVSDGYWIEKLTIASSQKGEEYNSKETRKEIEDGIKFELEEYGYEGEELEKAKEYYNDLLDYVDLQEWEYVSFAYNNFPNFMDSESVPFVETTKYWLKAVFDAFEEICRIIKG